MFLKEVRDGIAGKHDRYPGKFPMLDSRAGVIPKKSLITIAAFMKTGKTAWIDERYILWPYLKASEEVLRKTVWFYFSYEIDVMEKMAAFCCYFLNYFHNIRVEAEVILGRKKDKDGNTIILPPDVHEKVIEIYNTHIEKLLGKWDDDGRLISEGMIKFFQQSENPTGIYKRLMTWASSVGEFQYKTDKDGNKLQKIAYIEKDSDLQTIVLLDHIGLLKRESGLSKKENIDKMIDYFVELRNFCKFTIIPTTQLNRDMSRIERLKFSGEVLQPGNEDIKDSSSLAESSEQVFILFEPSRYPHIKNHLGYKVDKLKRYYRSVHLVSNRRGESGLNFGFFFDGMIKRFAELPKPQLGEASMKRWYDLVEKLEKVNNEIE